MLLFLNFAKMTRTASQSGAQKHQFTAKIHRHNCSTVIFQLYILLANSDQSVPTPAMDGNNLRGRRGRTKPGTRVLGEI